MGQGGSSSISGSENGVLVVAMCLCDLGCCSGKTHGKLYDVIAYEHVQKRLSV